MKESPLLHKTLITFVRRVCKVSHVLYMENKTLYNASTKLTSERQKDTEQLNKNIRGHQSLASESVQQELRSNKSQFEPVGVNH